MVSGGLANAQTFAFSSRPRKCSFQRSGNAATRISPFIGVQRIRRCRPDGRQSRSDRQTRFDGAPSSTFSNTAATVTIHRSDTLSGLLLSDVRELGHFFLSLIFVGLTARVIPLRSGLRVFCFQGSSPESMGPSHKTDASLRLHASLSLAPQGKRARKKTKTKCLINMLAGIACGAVRSPTVPSLEHGCLRWPLPERRPATTTPFALLRLACHPPVLFNGLRRSKTRRDRINAGGS